MLKGFLFNCLTDDEVTTAINNVLDMFILSNWIRMFGTKVFQNFVRKFRPSSFAVTCSVMKRIPGLCYFCADSGRKCVFQTWKANAFEITSLRRLHACTCGIVVQDLETHCSLLQRWYWISTEWFLLSILHLYWHAYEMLELNHLWSMHWAKIPLFQ